MPTKAELETQLKEAMRSGDELRKRTLRMVLAAIKLDEVDQRGAIDEAGVLKALQKEAKGRRETIEDAQKAKRQDLIDAAEAELALLETYLPQPLSESEIERLANQVIKETGAAGAEDLGKVMGRMMAQTAGRADGSQVSRIVRRLLSESKD
ncbi:MAG TPA: GatB/YqeY domain-containing protein [Anaerolineales bacterium]|jgi:hypothetical protein